MPCSKEFIRTFSLLLPLLCMTLAAAMPVAAQQGNPDARYAALLERVRAGDTTVDFNELRLTYAQTAAYAPDTEDQNVQLRMRAALAAEEFEKALAAADTLLRTNYLGIEAHYVCLVAQQELGRQKQSDYHGWVVNRLLRSILESGDGTTPKSAFVVISVAEEYDLLQIYGLEHRGQKLDYHDGIPYDIMTVFNTETNKEHIFYFDISRPMAHLSRLLEGTDRNKTGRE